MQVYTNKKSEKSRYIRNIELYDDGTFSLEFADGTVYSDYAATEENIAKVRNIMESQADDGLAIIGNFKADLVVGEILAATGAAACTGTVISILNGAQTVEQGLLALGGILISPAIMLLGAVKTVISKKRLNELAKKELCDLMKSDIANIGDYPHALVDVRPEIISLVETEEVPFAAMNYKRFKTSDLQKINGNIERDKELKLTMSKTKKL